jgi:hypothetical protein
MSPYPDNPGPLPAVKLCNVSPPNPVTGDGALGNYNKGKMNYRGSDKENLVKCLQQMLLALGHEVGKAGVDGKFGNDTESGVISFQEQGFDWEGNALKPDGLVGPRTSEALNRSMVGVWYDSYQTPVELTEGKLLFTATNDAFKAGLSIERGEAMAAKVIVLDYKPPKIEPKLKFVLDDFLVLTPKKAGMDDTFMPSDRLVIEIDGEEFGFRKKNGEVFIRTQVLVVGRLGKDYNNKLIAEGDGYLWVEDAGGKQQCEDVPCRIISNIYRELKTEIPMGDKPSKYHIAIVANPGMQEAGKTGNDPAFEKDEILGDRPAFHRRVIRILESFFDSAEGVLREEEIEPYIRVYALFDDSLPADADNSLLRKKLNSNIVGPRSLDLPDLLNNFIGKYQEKADIVVAVSKFNFRCSAWFTTDDTAGTDYTIEDQSYKFGTNVKSPGSFGDTIYLLPENRGYDMLTPIHEYLHAMSEKDRGRITDLYEDSYLSIDVNVNKRKKSGDSIPGTFGKYNNKSYNSDAPAGSYVGRGGLGYPGSEGIKYTYGPELVDKGACNVMDNFTSSTIDYTRCRLDKLTHQYVYDRLTAKIKNRT